MSSDQLNGIVNSTIDEYYKLYPSLSQTNFVHPIYSSELDRNLSILNYCVRYHKRKQMQYNCPESHFADSTMFHDKCKNKIFGMYGCSTCGTCGANLK